MMINLLPHREWALARKRQEFANALLLAALLSLVFAVGTNVWMGQQLTTQLAANKILKKEISGVDGLLNITTEVKEAIAKLTLRETTLQIFQAERQRPTVWLQAVVENLPDGLYLTALKQVGNNVNIQGVARSNEEVFELLRQVARYREWLAQVELIEVSDAPMMLDELTLTGKPFAMRATLKTADENADTSADRKLSDAH